MNSPQVKQWACIEALDIMTNTATPPLVVLRRSALIAGALGLSFATLSVPSAAASEFRNTLTHDAARCSGASGTAVRITVEGVKQSSGVLRVQLYRGTKDDWLQKGRWINRIEMPARAGTMTVCMPAPAAGTYAIAVRHDINGNGKTDLSTDGGGMSNNPNINIFNLGRPSHTRTAFTMNNGVHPITITMRYR